MANSLPPWLQTAGLVLLAFVSGSLPFSVWLSRALARADVRRYGDGNPGATNAFRAGGPVVGLLALVLDVSKAAAPVGWAYVTLGVRGPAIVLIATAALVGHAVSPFLGFRGGKALAVTLGVWIGLTLWRLSLPALALVLVWHALLDVDGWAVMLTLLGLAVILLIWMPTPVLLTVLAGQVIVLAWTHRADLRRRPHLRAWLVRRLRR